MAIPFVGLATLATASVQAPKTITTSIDTALPELLTTYRHLHRHPELSYHERDTAELLAARLGELGFDVTSGLGDYGDEHEGFGLIGVLANGDGPTVLVRTDLDALPVDEETGADYASTVHTIDESGADVPVMHACGHDVHMTVWLGTARVLAAHRDLWHGKLVMLGQPAEERGAGARAMLADDLYHRIGIPDTALALHVSASLPAGRIGLHAGYALASVDSVDVTIRGVGGHGAYPHTTIDPIVLAAQAILGFQTIVSRNVSPLEPAVITVGSIHGGSKHNVIPDHVDLQLTVRSYEPKVRQQLLDGIRRVAEGTARAAGVPDDLLPIVHVRDEEFTPSLYNDPELMTRLRPALEKALGDEQVVDAPPVMGGEDFSRYALPDRSVPIQMFWLGAVDPTVMAAAEAAGRPLPSLHSGKFCPAPEPTIRTGITAMTAAVLALMAR